MNKHITLSPDKIWVVRVKSNDHVFYVEIHRLREEIPALYRGFEQWHKDQWNPIVLDQLLQVHKDMRLGTEMPQAGICFCDLSQDDVTTNPWNIGKKPDSPHQEIWEYLPFDHAVQPVCMEADQGPQMQEVLEETLYRS